MFEMASGRLIYQGVDFNFISGVVFHFVLVAELNAPLGPFLKSQALLHPID